jgi:hypothetical protein
MTMDHGAAFRPTGVIEISRDVHMHVGTLVSQEVVCTCFTLAGKRGTATTLAPRWCIVTVI